MASTPPVSPEEALDTITGVIEMLLRGHWPPPLAALSTLKLWKERMSHQTRPYHPPVRFEFVTDRLKRVAKEKEPVDRPVEEVVASNQSGAEGLQHF